MLYLAGYFNATPLSNHTICIGSINEALIYVHLCWMLPGNGPNSNPSAIMFAVVLFAGSCAHSDNSVAYGVARFTGKSF